ncbi:PQQ-like domain-containing protein [Gordonia sp. v-85]|nr:PQQ-like domain-containing protein [Gordonia sp. v-85]
MNGHGMAQESETISAGHCGVTVGGSYRRSSAASRFAGYVTTVSAVAGIVLSGLAFVQRAPSGRVSDGFWTGPQWAATTLVLGVSLGLSLVIGVVLLSFVGRGPAIGSALVSGVCLAYSVRSEAVDTIAALTGGPGGHDVVRTVLAAWACLLVAAVAATFRRDRLSLREVGAIAVVALVVTLAIGLMPFERSGATGADAIRIPEVPPSVTGEPAYRVDDVDPWSITPAGPGFAAVVDDILVAYDGTTGRPRWSLTPDGVGAANCAERGFDRVTSTGTGTDSVVVVGCDYARAGRVGYFTTGIDAMTGQVLWTNDSPWILISDVPRAGRVDQPVAVIRDGEMAVLEPRSGEVRWQRRVSPPTGRDEPNPHPRSVFAAGHHVVYVTPDRGHVKVVVFDALTGADRTHRIAITAADERFDVSVGETGDSEFVAHLWDLDDVPRALVVSIANGGHEPVDRWWWGSDARGRRMTGIHVNAQPSWGMYFDQPGAVVIGHLDSRSSTRVTIPKGTDWPRDPIPESQSWVLLHDSVVTAQLKRPLENQGRYDLTTIHPGGSIASVPSPCGQTLGGVVPVPGAVLVTCFGDPGDLSSPVSVAALRPDS